MIFKKGDILRVARTSPVHEGRQLDTPKFMADRGYDEHSRFVAMEDCSQPLALVHVLALDTLEVVDHKWSGIRFEKVAED